MSIMKQITYITCWLFAMLLTLGACDREKLDMDKNETTEDNRPEGQISLAALKVAVNLDVNVNISTKAEEGVNTDNFIIRIFDRDNNGKLVKEWKYSEMPEIFALKIGNYTAAAYSHDELPAEFDRPFYYGKQDFTIVENDITEINTIECILQSIMVTVEYDDPLKALLGNDVQAIVKVGEGQLTYAKDETRAGFFQAASESENVLTTALTGTIEGAEVHIDRGFNNIKRGEHRIVRYTLKSINEGDNYEGGGADITLRIDVTCTIVEENVVVDPIEDLIDEDEENPDTPTEPETPGDDNTPTIVGKNFNGSPFDIGKSITLPEDKVDLVVSLNAPKGIATVNVKIESNTLTADVLEGVGLCTEFSLVECKDGNGNDISEGLSGLGFPIKDDVVGKSSLDFTLTEFTTLLGALGAGTHKFIITVTDQSTPALSTTKTLTLITE